MSADSPEFTVGRIVSSYSSHHDHHMHPVGLHVYTVRYCFCNTASAIVSTMQLVDSRRQKTSEPTQTMPLLMGNEQTAEETIAHYLVLHTQG